MNFIKRKRCLINRFIRESENMIPGEYVFDTWLTYIHIKDNQVSDKAKEMFSKKPKKISHLIITLLVRNLFFKRNIYINKTKKNVHFEGTVYLPANNKDLNRDAKIFDFKNEKVMSILSDEITFNEKMGNYQHFNKYFPIPCTLSQNKQELIIIEEMIEFTSGESWINEKSVFFINDLFFRYTKYLNECYKTEDFHMKTPNDLFKELYDTNEKVNDFFLRNISDELKNMEFPFVKLHGDLWSANILLKDGSSSDFYYIDWEHATDFILFYDVFWFFQNEAIYNKNYIFINSYINGLYDEYFKGMFKAYDITYREEFRRDYLVIFYLNVFVTRLNQSDKTTKAVVYNQLVELFDKIN